MTSSTGTSWPTCSPAREPPAAPATPESVSPPLGTLAGVRTADITIGAIYAHARSYNPHQRYWMEQVSRVRVTGLPGHGKADVVVLDGPTDPSPWRETLEPGPATVATREIACTWDEHEANLAALTRAESDRQAAAEVAHEARQPRADRLLPGRYSHQLTSARHRRRDDDTTYDVAFTTYAEQRWRVRDDDPGGWIGAALDAIGEPGACRDVVGAMQAYAEAVNDGLYHHGGFTAPPLDTLELSCDSALIPVRAASDDEIDAILEADEVPVSVAEVLADTARWIMMGPERTLAWFRALRDHDRAFVSATVGQADAVGVDVGMPETPPVPHWARTDLDGFGWLPLLNGSTSGNRLHDPECNVLRPGRHALERAMTITGWLLAVVQQETCGVCGGPVLRVTPEWIAFRAASDVWVARGGGLVELWQRRAVMRFAASCRMQLADRAIPCIGPAGRVYAALIDGMPAQRDQEALAIIGPWGPSWPEGTSAADIEAARQRVLRRLRDLHSALPADRRPAAPSDMNAIAAGTVNAADIDSLLRLWWDQLSDVVAVPNLRRLLFG